MFQPPQISIAVQGRFHAFDLVRALSARDDVRVNLLTNYSPRACARFGIDPELVTSYRSHRYAVALLMRCFKQPLSPTLEAWMHESFGRWACRTLERQATPPDVIRIFSGVAEETLRSPLLARSLRIVTRGSSHIRVQRQLLDAEELRAGVRMDKPSDYILAREEREYALAHSVVVLSTFAQRTFLDSGHPAEKLWLLPNAVNLKWYGAAQEVLAARRQRLLSGAPLRVLMVGSFSFRKGILDLAAVVTALAGRFQFRFVGDVLPEGRALRQALHGQMEFRDRVPPDQLAAEYAWGDVFFFPTIEDGFPAVLSQALAAGLPVLTTPNGSGPDVVQEGINGWIVPARGAAAMVQRLEWGEMNRNALAVASEAATRLATSRSWNDVAEEFVGCIQRAVTSTTEGRKK